MSRLIDADKVNPCDVFGGLSDFAQDCRNAVIELLSIQPTIDAVPVVRCKDCKYRTWFAPYYGCGNFESPFYVAVDKDVAIMTKPDDYCSYGERREEA